MKSQRETIDFDVLFVGGGPAGLAGAIRLMQQARRNHVDLEVALIEKGAEIGSHALSGAVMNPAALEELIPDYEKKGCPIETRVRGDEFYFLTPGNAFQIPVVPKYMHNSGYLIISLSRFTRWLAGIAEDLGVNIFPGFAGQEVLYGSDGKTVIGVRTGDKGIGPDGSSKINFEPGIDLTARVTVLGEGAKGSLTRDVFNKLTKSEDGRMPQVYETGIKEVIQLPGDTCFTTRQGNVIHTMGYPIGLNTPGGGFVYEMKSRRIALGFLVGLSYRDPGLDVYEQFIRFKRHPFVSELIEGGKVIEQGARTVSTGGYYSIPELAVDGAVFIGGGAGMQNVPGLKGIHLSMKSGMLAADAVLNALEKGEFTKKSLWKYQQLFDGSRIKDEMFEGRNFAAALAKTGVAKWTHLAAQYVTNGRGLTDPMPLEEDFKTLSPARPRREVPAPGETGTVYDGILYLDKLSGVYMSRTMHREDQPCHIVIHDRNLCVTRCFDTYQCPCTRFCPGNVYEIETDDRTLQKRLKLNPSNCLHCKTCEIKDPYNNITWNCPEGGEGPGYTVV